MNRKLYISIYTLLLLTFGFSSATKAQIQVDADSVVCGALGTTLHANLYGEDSTTTGISVDDEYSGKIPIGFTFNYYGVNYDTLLIGGNGVICFNLALANAFCPWGITAVLAGNANALNSICGPWCDVDIRFGGTMTCSTIGVAPNRRFVATWCRTAMYSCNDQYLNSQIILYEGSSLIEVHIGYKDICTTWNGAAAIVGVQNASGTASTVAPSRDFPTVWTAYREAWQFTPAGGGSSYTVSSIPYSPVPFRYSVISWYDSVTNTYLGSGTSLYVSATTPTTVYAAAAGCADSNFSYYHVDLSTLVSSAYNVRADFVTELHPGCKADTVFITNLSSPTGNISKWDFGDGSPLDSTTLNPIHVYAAQGTYNIHLKYYDLTGCKDTADRGVTFNHPISAAFTASPTDVCLGQSNTFTNASVGQGATYRWSFGDGNFSNDQDPVFTYKIPGEYNVKLTVTDSFNCTAEIQGSPIKVISVTAATEFVDTIVCLRAPMPLHSSYTVKPWVSDAVIFSWSPAGGISNPNIAEPEFWGTGDYTHSLTVSLATLGCSATATQHIFSEPPLVLTNVTASQAIPLGGSIQLNAGGAYVYVWSANDGSLNNPNINNPVVTPIDTATTYQVIGMSRYGCKDTAYVTITTTQDTFITVPSAFTPNNDGKNDYFRPFVMRFQKIADFRVFNRWGKEMFHASGTTKGWDGTFDGEPQDLGVYGYLLVVSLADGSLKTISGNVTLIR